LFIATSVLTQRRASPRATPAAEITKESLLVSLYTEVTEDRVLAVAAGVAFYGLLAVFPAITALVSLYGLFNDQSEASQDLAALAGVLPAEMMSVITDQVLRITSGSDVTLGFATAISLAIALWSANAGMKAITDALNVAYGVKERRSFIWLNVQSLFFTLSALIFLLIMMAAVAVVPVVLGDVLLSPAVQWLLWAGRWPVLLLLLALALGVLYRFGPDVPDAKWRWISPGSVLATLGLVLLSMLFSYYAASLGRFNETYGSLGAAIALLTWLWLSATIIMLGAELNAEMDRRKAAAAAAAGADPFPRGS
jgi:membrane protein